MRILVFGDSLVYGKWDEEGGWVSRLRKYIDKKYNIEKRENFLVYNFGIPSELAIDLARRFEGELVSRMDKNDRNLVIIETGANDSCPNNRTTGKKTPPEDFKNALRGMADFALKQKCELIFLGLAPVNPARSKGLLFSEEGIREYDGYITDAAKELGVRKLEILDELNKMNFSDLLVDSAHPNSAGHEVLAEMVAGYLEI